MNIQKLKKVIIKANPEMRIYYNRCMDCGYGFEYCKCKPKKTEWYRDREIRLADVLLAIQGSGNGFIGITDGGVFFHEDDGLLNGIWNLKDNNLDNQSDELYKFLNKLLVKNI